VKRFVVIGVAASRPRRPTPIAATTDVYQQFWGQRGGQRRAGRDPHLPHQAPLGMWNTATRIVAPERITAAQRCPPSCNEPSASSTISDPGSQRIRP
jgi:hypothetical protein